jgi:hypothetical protein
LICLSVQERSLPCSIHAKRYRSIYLAPEVPDCGKGFS